MIIEHTILGVFGVFGALERYILLDCAGVYSQHYADQCGKTHTHYPPNAIVQSIQSISEIMSLIFDF